MSRVKRAVGYCNNPECDEAYRGTFLMNHSGEYYCPRCRFLGLCVAETSRTLNDLNIFKEVRVEYNYEPTTGHYRELAIVMDTSLKVEANVFNLYSPLIRTEKRALKVAEGILATLQRGRWTPQEEAGIPPHSELLMDLDRSREDFLRDCHQLGKDLEISSLARGVDKCQLTNV